MLRFSVEYLGPQGSAPAETRAAETCRERRDRMQRLNAVYGSPQWFETVVDWIIQNHDRKTRGRQFGAIMAVISVDALLSYYDAFEARRQAGAHDMKIATIDHRLPMLGLEDDIRAAFAEFWSEERDQAYADLCAREDLDPAGVERLVRTIVLTGKRPLTNAVVDAMNIKSGILARRSAIERVLAGIEHIIATFDDGVGDRDE